MSLISSQGATDRVVVVLRRLVVDGSRRQVPEEYGRVVVVGRLSPLSSSDIERLAGTGEAVAETMRFSTADFPGDHLSLVDDGAQTWRVVGTPRRRRGSRRTARTVVYLTAEHQPRGH